VFFVCTVCVVSVCACVLDIYKAASGRVFKSVCMLLHTVAYVYLLAVFVRLVIFQVFCECVVS